MKSAPFGGKIRIENAGKYLGFLIGPGAGNKAWHGAMAKYMSRASSWSSMHLGLHFNMHAYRAFAAPVLSFLMQLEPDPIDLYDNFCKALHLLAPGPGNWVSPEDLTHLQSVYKFPLSFQDPRWVALAAKLSKAKGN